MTGTCSEKGRNVRSRSETGQSNELLRPGVAQSNTSPTASILILNQQDLLSNMGDVRDVLKDKRALLEGPHLRLSQ